MATDLIRRDCMKYQHYMVIVQKSVWTYKATTENYIIVYLSSKNCRKTDENWCKSENKKRLFN